MPRISVILPIRNGRPYASAAIESILRQTEPDFELLIIDDGSSDGTEMLLHEFSRCDKRVKLYTQPALGLVAALERGCANSSAPIIARMDGDDISLPGRFAAQLRYLDENPEVVAVGGQVRLIDSHSRPLRIMPFPVEPESCQSYLSYGSPLCHPAAMMRADALARCGGYRKKYRDAEDFDLWLRMAKLGELANLDSVVLHYRTYDKSVTASRARAQAIATALALVDATVVPADAPSDLPSEDEWPVIEARLSPAIRLDARIAYLRALCLNGGITEPSQFTYFCESLPDLRRYAKFSDTERMLAFMLVRGVYQLARARQFGPAIELAEASLQGLRAATLVELGLTIARRGPLLRHRLNRSEGL